jgi:hypothetical protein
MKISIVLLLSLIAFGSCFTFMQIEQNLKEKCCVSCLSPAIKYVSLRNDKCGESCLDPKDYQRIKIFEPTLVKAETNTPCADKQFTIYNGTVTHGIGTLKAILDMYLHE